MRLSSFVAILASLCILTACSNLKTTASSQLESTSVDDTAAQAYRIGVDDVVNVSVWRNPDLSVSVPVRPDNMISVPLVGDVRAGGLTPEALAHDIRESLSEFIREPQVTVIVTGLNSTAFLSRVRITGAVNNPLSLPYRKGMTVLDLVLESGGLNDFALANSTKLYRRSGSEGTTLSVNLGDILKRGRLQTNYLLQPGDILTVPERLF